MADPSWRPLAGGVAQRRRERRLRSWYRHEQQTVRMALAAFSHHSALRRQTKARAGEEGHEEHNASRRQKPPPLQPELFNLEEEPGGGLPAPLSEVAGRQDKVVRHVLEDLGSVCPVVQILDLPVPHMMDQLAELLNLEEDVLDAGRLVDRIFQVPELVIEVPKIGLDVIPLRTLVPEPQLVEQLVEVPTTISYSSLQRTVEQHVDISVPQSGGQPSSGLQGFSSGQSSTASLSKKRILSGLWSRSLTLFLVEVFTVHLLLTLQLVMKNAQMSLAKGFFALFPKIKKVRSWARTRGRNCSPSRAHPRRLLSWRTPSSGCCSRTATLASLTTGTDVLSVQSGSRRLTLRLCGSAKGMRREGSGTGTGKRASLCLTSLLFLLGEVLHRQPRAVYKYWVGGLPSCDHATTCSSSSSSFMADMDQKGRCSGMYKLVFLVLHLALCCPRRTGKLDYVGDGVYFFFGPLYLEVTCSSFCLRTGLLISGR